MTVSKYEKYIVKEMKQNIAEAPWTPPMSVAGKGKGGRVLWLDNEVIPGAFYVETVWEFPLKASDPPKASTQAHKHDFDEVLCFFGTNPDDPYDLCGEVEFWLGDEKHTITKSCIIFIPKGLQHCPLTIKRADRPIFEFTAGPGSMYG
jgi:quercetin dioxygenase-like cupin family protein